MKKPSSVLGAVVGAIFVLLGIVIIIPQIGLFGIVWTLLALSITGYHLYNFFSKKGVKISEVDIKENHKNNI